MARKLWIGLLVAALLGALGYVVQRAAAGRKARTAWLESLPAQPDISRFHPEFRERVAAAVSGARERVLSTADLGELANLYLANGFLREAELALQALCRWDAENPRWPHHLATLLAGYGRIEEALAHWERVKARAPEYVPAVLKLGDGYTKSNRPDEARAAYEHILAREPSNPYALLGRARLEVEAGRWSGARRLLEAAVAAEPNFSSGLSLLATVAERLGDEAAARNARARAASIGRSREAPDPWSEELTAYCYDPYRLQVIAATAAAMGDPVAALRSLEKALRIAPDDPRTHRQRAKIFARSGDNENAQKAFRRSIELRPEEAGTYLELVEVYRASNRYEEAEAVLRDGLSRSPQSAGLNYELGMLLLRNRDFDAAAEHFAKARDAEPENLAAQHELIALEFRRGRRAEAVELIDEALARNPVYAPILLMKVRYLVESGEAAAAETYLRRAEQAGASPRAIEELTRLFHSTFARMPNP